MPLLLVAAGGVFALLLVLNLLIQSLRRAPRIGFWFTLLAFLTTLLPLVALIINQASENSESLVTNSVLVIAAGVAGISLLGILLELRRPERLKQSRGVFGVGIGLLLALATFSVPFTFNYAETMAGPSPTPVIMAAVQTATASGDQVEKRGQATPTLTLTPTTTPTATASRTPRPSPTATATRQRFATRTPAPTPTLPNPCLALTKYNVNLRAEPDLDAEVLATIAYDTTVMLFGRNDDATWWYGEYEQQAGWLKGEFLTLTASCSALPEKK